MTSELALLKGSVNCPVEDIESATARCTVMVLLYPRELQSASPHYLLFPYLLHVDKLNKRSPSCTMTAASCTSS
jgi:hypothetical protein